MTMKKVQSVDEYLSALPKTVRDGIEKLRKAIRTAAPQAEEVISYNIPAFKWTGILVWYAAHKEHFGLYPRVSAILAFKEELAGYKTTKGAIQFPMTKAIPTNLIKMIVKFRMKENEAKAATAKKATAKKGKSVRNLEED
jgi:uncharacterized protein YdhG (YjbR/CyaY superfamily)